MVNTELLKTLIQIYQNYNILNIVVNTERDAENTYQSLYYNILNIVVNTELFTYSKVTNFNYNILNIVVNTEPFVTRPN